MRIAYQIKCVTPYDTIDYSRSPHVEYHNLTISSLFEGLHCLGIYIRTCYFIHSVEYF